MEKHKEVFFVIRLHSAQSAASLAVGFSFNSISLFNNKSTNHSMFSFVVSFHLQPIQDPDPPINCDLMDGRDSFLTMARDKHYEFSSLRRAQYSTLCMLYELHNQGQDKFVYTCNHCKNHVETRYHCTVCDVSVRELLSKLLFFTFFSLNSSCQRELMKCFFHHLCYLGLRLVYSL